MSEPSMTSIQKQQFNVQVWEIARQIPAGKVASYGQLAAFIPPPAGMDLAAYAAFRARWAGAAMRECPGDVPWQRVLNAQGKISLPAGSRGALEQRRMLESEGVEFDARERIDLARFGWAGPPRDWLLERGLLAPDQDFQQGSLL